MPDLGEPHHEEGAMKRIVVLVVVLSLGLWMVPMSTPTAEVGEKAPDFVMHSTVGESVHLADYQGKKNVLMFFFVAAFTDT
jgi:hypothetical protein